MIQIQQLKLPTSHSQEDLLEKACKILKINKSQVLTLDIHKRSIDARKKPNVYFVYTLRITTKEEASIVKRANNRDISLVQEKTFTYLEVEKKEKQISPIIIGTGPAGIFCGYYLAKAGLNPILVERGEPVEERKNTVDKFWTTGELNLESNVQFGEGGAGTFSDGKLNSMVKDPTGRNREVLKIFVEAGAPEEIKYINKPHIGTDILENVVVNLRNEIINLGGTFLFHHKMIDFTKKEKKRVEVVLENVKNHELHKMTTNALILAIGHSARETFELLYRNEIQMEGKSFAIGVRMEHPQEFIDKNQYGVKLPKDSMLPVADYKVTANLENQRGVYSFCMCPGGYVVDASSEENRLVINGMSYNKRDGSNANSAIIVTVDPKDFEGSSPLAGMEFQRKVEEKAYQLGNGKIPVQLFEDFCNNKRSQEFKSVIPAIKGSYEFADLNEILPEYICQSIQEGIYAFDKKIPGFARKDSILSGVETRTSSPVRIIRNQELESSIENIYPCGEGAGYAGGIMSAAMDGLKVADAIVKKLI